MCVVYGACIGGFALVEPEFLFDPEFWLSLVLHITLHLPLPRGRAFGTETRRHLL